MKKRALWKDIIRDIKKSRGRFLSIVAIISLGVAFFSGLKISPENMKFTADKYYKDYKLMDIRILSNLGLTEDDLQEIKKIEGVKEAEGNYFIDALALYEEREVVFKIHGITKENINTVNLVEGRMPENPGEAVIEKGKNDSIVVPLGSIISLNSGKEDPLSDHLKYTEYEIVGKVQTPYYLSFEKGNSDIGNGTISNFIMVPKEDFKFEVYTEILTLVSGANQVNSYREEYFEIVDPVRDKLEELATNRELIRYDEILEEAKEELDKGKREYFDEKAKAEKELSEALEEIEEGKLDIANGEKELADEEAKFNKTIREGRLEIEKAEKDLAQGEKQYEEGLVNFNNKKQLAEEEFNQAEMEIKKGEQGIIQLEEAIAQLKAALENPQLPEEQREKLNIDLQTTIITLDETKLAIEKGKEELKQGRQELAEGEVQLEETKDLLNSSRLKLEGEKSKLLKGEREGKEELRKAREDLEKAKIDLAEGEKEYNEEKAKAEDELAKAWKEIEDAEKDINNIKKAKWYVLDRNSHYSYVDYGGAADAIDSLAKVFPVFFALVAALVSLTTMTRMVDEQRINIGTLKALGYSNVSIASKYMFYALSATIIGCIVGIAIGYTVFPIVIFNAYGIMYVLPPVSLQFNINLAILVSLTAIVLTTMTALLATINELKENPSSLMRPRAPKMGKRILLERIPIIWNRFNFSGKVTIRNLFRYKRRFFMTIFGIAGCTALMLSAFGIKDSIRAVSDIQFGEIQTYDITVGLEDEGIKYLDQQENIVDYQLIFKEGGQISFKGEIRDLSIIAPKDIKKIDEFIHLRNRKDGIKIHIPDNGIIITEQISKTLKIHKGDEIKLINNEDEEALVKVVGIAENYTFNYAYLSPTYYNKIFNKEVKFNEAIGILRDTSYEEEDKLSRILIKEDEISNVSFNTAFKEEFEDIIGALNYVVIVMILSAGGLAFVVLYNLTNVNISERIREIATIKVLGFYDNEVAAYIYRENILLTLIGTLLGLGMGIFLHRYIMTTVEMENIMFGLKLNPRSYLYAVILTIVFSVFVNFAMYYKLKNVEMVESLKSID